MSISKYSNSYIPKTYDKYLGIELEFFGSDHLTICKELNKKKIKGDIELKDDSSINPDEECCDDCIKQGLGYCVCDQPQSHELCLLSKQEDYKLDLLKVMTTLNKLKCAVNKSCGLHVHLDMRDRPVHTAYNNLIKCQDLLFDLNPKRKGNSFCKKISTDSMKKDIKNNRDHYNGISGSPISDLGTIEIRMHGGSLDYIRVARWIDLLLEIVDAPLIKDDIDSVYKFNKYITKDRRLTSFVKGALV
jgi:predicted peroxiredoxin